MASKKTKSLFSGASVDSFFLLFVRLITILVSLVVTRIMSGHFSIHEYGTYSQLILLSTSLSTLTILGMTDGVNYFFAKEKEEAQRSAYVSTIFFLQSIVGIITTLIVLALTVPISIYFDNSDVKSLIVFAAIMPVLQNLINMLQVMFMAIGKAKLIAFRNLALSILKLVSILIACFVFDNIAVVLICQVIMEIAQVAYFIIVLKKNNCTINILRFDVSLVREILKYCLPMGMFTVSKALNKDCDKFVVAAFTDTETLAVYTNASKYLPFEIIMGAFVTVLTPYITRYISEKMYPMVQKLYKSFLELSYITTSTMVVGAVCVAPELMELLYTEKYLSGLNIFIIYILVEILNVFNVTLLLCASGKTNIVMGVGLGALVLNLCLNIAFFKLFGLMGPAFATVFVTLVQGVVIFSTSAKEIQTNIFDMFDKKFLAIFILELVGVGVFTSVIRELILKLTLPSIITMCICLIVYVIPLALLNFNRLKGDIKSINSCKLQSRG